MDIKSLETEADYRKALKRLEELFDAPEGTTESNEAEILAMMIDEYEKKQYPI